MADGPVELLVVDVDGVLYRYDRGRRVAELARALDRPEAAVHDALFASGIEDLADAGELDAEEYLTALGEQLGTTVTRRAWAAARAAAMTPDDDVLALVQRVSMDTPVASLSNNGALMAEEAPRIVPELAALGGARMFFGGVLRAAKPGAAAYERVLATYGVAPGAAAFVDDDEDYVAGADAVGLRTHLFTGASDLAVFLSALRLL
jgi:putative hydrolase of the HAD superfamily